MLPATRMAKPCKLRGLAMDDRRASERDSSGDGPPRIKMVVYRPLVSRTTIQPAASSPLGVPTMFSLRPLCCLLVSICTAPLAAAPAPASQPTHPYFPLVHGTSWKYR